MPTAALLIFIRDGVVITSGATNLPSYARETRREERLLACIQQDRIVIVQPRLTCHLAEHLVDDFSPGYRR